VPVVCKNAVDYWRMICTIVMLSLEAEISVCWSSSLSDVSNVDACQYKDLRVCSQVFTAVIVQIVGVSGLCRHVVYTNVSTQKNEVACCSDTLVSTYKTTSNEKTII
jgi:hypothetical protein